MASQYNGFTDARKEANERYRKSGKMRRAELTIPAEDWPIWDNYATALDMSRSTMIRQCVERCMVLDGFIQPKPELEPVPEPCAEPKKQKRGRPRKTPVE